MVAIFGMIDPDIVAWARGLMKGLDFSEVVFQGMLGRTSANAYPAVAKATVMSVSTA